MVNHAALAQYRQDQYAGAYFKMISDSFHFNRFNNTLKIIQGFPGGVPYYD
jgi:hypothetical protein